MRRPTEAGSIRSALPAPDSVSLRATDRKIRMSSQLCTRFPLQFCKTSLAHCPFDRHFCKAMLRANQGRDHMKELTHFINGAQVKGTSGTFGDVYNPATG